MTMKWPPVTVVFICLIITSGIWSQEKPYQFGVVPQQSPFKLHRVWQPVIDYLEKETGLKIHFRTERSIDEFGKKVVSGLYDIAYMSPYHYARGSQSQNYIAVARSVINIKGVVVVRKDSGIDHVHALKNDRFLFPAARAFGATMLVKYDLRYRFSIDIEQPGKYLYVNSHDSVYKAVARHIARAGGGIERTFHNQTDRKSFNDLKIIHTTRGYPSHPFSLHPRISQDHRKRITAAILSLPESLIKPLHIPEIKRTSQYEYNGVKHLVKKMDEWQK